MGKRVRDLGIKIGTLKIGQYNAITDVPGVLVGHSTIIKGKSIKGVTNGIVRTGVTVVYPHKDIFEVPVFAGIHILNGNGEMTGTAWVEESGLLTTPIGLTNTHSVGIVRDSMISYVKESNELSKSTNDWMLPIIAETWDGWLNDINGMHIKKEHVYHALKSACSGFVEEGNVGGGTGMICYEFKGGIGTSSRLINIAKKSYKVGVLVQANYGKREQLLVEGVPVGQKIPISKIPGKSNVIKVEHSRAGSIIIIVGTDIPLLPDQCRRLARRASLGLARMGSISENTSGDLFIAFSTGNKISSELLKKDIFPVYTIKANDLTPVFEAVVEATQEAILNALCAGETMSGILGRTIYELPKERLISIINNYK